MSEIENAYSELAVVLTQKREASTRLRTAVSDYIEQCEESLSDIEGMLDEIQAFRVAVASFRAVCSKQVKTIDDAISIISKSGAKLKSDGGGTTICYDSSDVSDVKGEAGKEIRAQGVSSTPKVLNDTIAGLQVKQAKNLMTLEAKIGIEEGILESLKKSLERLEKGMPTDDIRYAWCADLTEDLTGEVGTIEVPGEIGTIQIQPGHNDTAKYQAARDGQLMPVATMTPAQAFYNLAMLPGWQKWRPLYRYGFITEKYVDDKADVRLSGETSSQQNINIDQESDLYRVPIEYMTCNGAAFSVDDEVLIKFEGQKWEEPKIIGFKEEPKGCGSYVYIYIKWDCIVWDVMKEEPCRAVVYNDGSPVNIGDWPVDRREISEWLNNYRQIKEPLYGLSYCFSQLPWDGVDQSCYLRGTCFWDEIPDLKPNQSDSYEFKRTVTEAVTCPDADGHTNNENILTIYSIASVKYHAYDPVPVYGQKGYEYDFSSRGYGDLELPIIPNGKVVNLLAPEYAGIGARSLQVSTWERNEADYSNDMPDDVSDQHENIQQKKATEIKTPWGVLMEKEQYSAYNKQLYYEWTPEGMKTIKNVFETATTVSGSLQNTVWSAVSDTVIVQLWYYAGLRIEKRDQLDKKYIGGRWIDGPNAYSWATLKDRALHATVSFHEDVFKVDPFTLPRSQYFEEFVLDLIDLAKEKKQVDDPEKPYLPYDLELRILE